MLEIPEASTIARQLQQSVVGKTITTAIAGSSPHKMSWYTGEPATYGSMLRGKLVTAAAWYGGRPEMQLDDVILSFCDGTLVRYLEPGEARPTRHQLRLDFSDGSAVFCSVQMYGGIFCFSASLGAQDGYYQVAKEKPSPLSPAFDEPYFASLLTDTTRKLSAKAFLASQQRIPGLGNGVLQDILWTARVHPKRKMAKLSDCELENLYGAVKSVLLDMADKGGRDTERDLFGNAGGYTTVMGKKNVGRGCPACGSTIQRMAYLGGNVYVCDECQK